MLSNLASRMPRLRPTFITSIGAGSRRILSPLHRPLPHCLRRPRTRFYATATTPSAPRSADDITVSEGLEPVRLRPGMYVGSTGPKGLHHLVHEVIDNAVDEALAGYCTKIAVTLHRDGSVSVRDDGRGIPTDPHPTTGKSALNTVMTVLHAGGKFGGSGYSVSGGLHDVGVSVVNALSEWLDVCVWRAVRRYSMRFTRGKVESQLVDAPNDGPTGTQAAFLPDSRIFTTTGDFDADIQIDNIYLFVYRWISTMLIPSGR